MLKTYNNLIVKDGLQIQAEFYQDENYLIIGYYFIKGLKDEALKVNKKTQVTVLHIDTLNFTSRKELIKYLNNGDFIDCNNVSFKSYGAFKEYTKDLNIFEF